MTANVGGGLWIDVGALAVAALSVLMSYLRTARLQGSDRQRIKSVEDAIGRVASVDSVSALATRIDDLEGEVKLVSTALTKIAVIDVKLDALDRLMSRETDEIKRSLRGLEARSVSLKAPVIGRGEL